MSVEITFHELVKKYGQNTVIPKLDLKIRKGEFFTLLGPSGCGKTTLLRMVAGFNSIEGGTISFNDRVINDLDAGKRNIGMVFQNYAVFPHLTVAGNVRFGLDNRKVSKAEAQKRVEEVLKVVKIDNLKDRLPQNMSGGQQQRITLARAIVIEPDVLLMDEPLSNLDAKLRVEMRDVIKELQHKVGITTIYVTHDQEEAMAVSDRIAVMKDGVIQQVGRPRSIYHRPANIFVATFIGSSNIIHGRLLRGDFGYRIQIGEYVNPIEGIEEQKVKDEAVLVSIRPEDFVISKDQSGLKGRVISSVFLGNSTRYDIELETGDVVMLMEESTETDHLIPDSKVYLKVKTEKINVYDREGNVNYSKGVVSDLE